ncbi:rhodanese-related sulfurtransferase [Cyanobacterium aponinum FACHB-4101]|uniref:oxygen-dependent tRNA uridine(34) hydroxylase TrhO n=1 Tax=Cyanobacterium aponinum TaxID=379064 RepID=UPI001680035F|nr:rhodanese-related sulfurtransferase [Cyanobacterium aponinum]MBD2395596.1 rhodanese-related sulfurtransferase [Cyanobacterium aponinum FACHB-4101]
MNLIFASFYRFLPLENLEDLQAEFLQWCQEGEIKGTILIAKEGINANIVGEKEPLKEVIEKIQKKLNCDEWEIKYSDVEIMPFARMKVKIKKEIITFGIPDADPNKRVGTYIKPKDWNNLISQPDVKLVDTRNEYEVQIGTFKGAENPHIDSFTELNKYIEEHLNPEKDQKVAMFCTGGIRCEKVTALMLSKGFKEVYHLQGGILKYLQEIPPEESLWEGECFVFDERVAVKHGLEKGSYKLCPETGEPIPV